MKTKDEIIKIIKDEMPILKEKFGIKKIGLFGSYARSSHNTESDVDLLVQFEKPIGFFKFIAAEDYLKDKLAVKVELVTEDALKPIIKPYVMKEVVYV
jgi:uncharacterized protein